MEDVKLTFSEDIQTPTSNFFNSWFRMINPEISFEMTPIQVLYLSRRKASRYNSRQIKKYVRNGRIKTYKYIMGVDNVN